MDLISFFRDVPQLETGKGSDHSLIAVGKPRLFIVILNSDVMATSTPIDTRILRPADHAYPSDGLASCEGSRSGGTGIAAGRWLLHVAVPITIGASIYLLFRTTSLLVFWWLDAVGLSPHVMVLRQCSSRVQLPDWVLYSLPDGIWVYAATSWLILIWRFSPPLLWLSVPLVLAVAGELGQAAGIIPGTYEHCDLVLYVSGFFLAILHLRRHDETARSVCDGDPCDGHPRAR